MNNNELTLENLFMTPMQRDTIKKIKAEQSHYYMQQRVTPHYIEAYPEATIVFQRYDLQQKPCATYTDTEDLLKEVDEVLRTKGNKRDNLALTPATEDNTADTTAPSQQGEARVRGKAIPCHETDQGIPNIIGQTTSLHKGLAQWNTLEKEKASLGRT